MRRTRRGDEEEIMLMRMRRRKRMTKKKQRATGDRTRSRVDLNAWKGLDEVWRTRTGVAVQ